MGNTGQARVRFEGSQPILRVENMGASLRFYVDVLGFENVDWGSDEFTSVSRDQAAIYLCRGGQGRGGAWVWIGVEDAERLHEECKTRGATIRLPPWRGNPCRAHGTLMGIQARLPSTQRRSRPTR